MKHEPKGTAFDTTNCCKSSRPILGIFFLGLISYAVLYVTSLSQLTANIVFANPFGVKTYRHMELCAMVVSLVLCIFCTVYPSLHNCFEQLPKSLVLDETKHALFMFMLTITLQCLVGGSGFKNIFVVAYQPGKNNINQLLMDIADAALGLVGVFSLFTSMLMVFSQICAGISLNIDFEVPIMAFILLPGAVAFVQMALEDQFDPGSENIVLILDPAKYDYAFGLTPLLGVLPLVGVVLCRMGAEWMID